MNDVDTMVSTEIDAGFVLDLMADASMPSAAAVRFIAFVRRYPTLAEQAAAVWTRHFGWPVYTAYAEKPVGALVG